MWLTQEQEFTFREKAINANLRIGDEVYIALVVGSMTSPFGGIHIAHCPCALRVLHPIVTADRRTSKYICGNLEIEQAEHLADVIGLGGYQYVYLQGRLIATKKRPLLIPDLHTVKRRPAPDRDAIRFRSCGEAAAQEFMDRVLAV